MRTGAELLSSLHRVDLLKRIKRELSVTEHVWQSCYLDLFERWAALIQFLPASEAHHHSFDGGLLDHSLECCLNALRLRRGYVLPANEPPENNSLKAERYSYGVAVCSLMHDSGKLLTDIDIVHGQPDKYYLWSPWSGPMTENSAYAFKFRLSRKHNQHEWAGSALLPVVVPQLGLQWLQEDKDLLVLLFAQMSGKQSLAGAIGEIIRKADKASVGRSLGGKQLSTPQSAQQSGSRSIALHEQLLMAIRYLFHEGRLTINKPGAAGWVKDGTVWLVSKATVEAASTHLFSEGIRTVPKNVARVFDILAEHDLAENTPDGKAVWKCKVHDKDRDWYQDLTMLKFKVESIWPNETPADLKGSITPIIPLTSAKKWHEYQAEEDQKKDQVQAQPAKPRAKGQPVQESSSDESMTDRSASSPKDYAGNTFDQGVPPYPVDDTPVMHDQNLVQMQDEGKPAADNQGQSKPKLAAKKTPGKQVGEDFLEWVKSGVKDRSIKINDHKALVHVVEGKAFLVSPAIFQRYARNPTVQVKLAMLKGVKSDYKKVQSGFQKLLLHEKRQGHNLLQCEVRGDRRVSTLSGYLVSDPALIFQDSVPSDNPHLRLPG